MTLIVIFHYHIVSWSKLQIHAVGGPSDFIMWVYIHQAIKQEKTYTQEQLKLIHINVSILNSHITVMRLRLIKNKLFNIKFLFFRTEKLNYFQLLPIGFFQARKLTTKWRLSKSLTFQNLLKNKKQLPAEIFINILLSTKNLKQSYYHSAGSFMENNLNNEFRVEISFMAK